MQEYLDVITIVRNSSASILKTLETVSSQTYPYINHIIIDGNSDDGTFELAKRYTSAKNVILEQHSPQGIANAFNCGIKCSRGELVIFLNSGDTFVSDRVVEEIIASYKEKQWLWAFGETISVSRRGYLKRHIKQYTQWSDRLFWSSNPICHQSTIYSQQLIEQVGYYDESIGQGMDYDYNVRCSIVSAPFLLTIPISTYDTTGVSSRKLIEGYQIFTKLRSQYFNLNWKDILIIDTLGYITVFKRFLMLPFKLYF